jgi:hypothetical protein
LLFTSTFLILGFLNFMAGVGDSYLLFQKDQILNESSIVEYRDFAEGTFFNRFYDYYDYLDYLSFLLLLVATGSLLYHYGKSINKSKLILIMALPLLSYTSSILDALNIYDTDTTPELFTYYIFQSATTISGGVLFAISFWYVSMKIPKSPVKTFLRMTALGFILLFVANHVSVSLASYPPFGINSLSLLPLASYVLLFGLYSSALSLSQDISLRHLIRRLARSDENLLSSMGTAEMGLEVSRAVNKLKSVVEKEGRLLSEISGIDVPVEEKEIEEYVNQVLEEVRKAKGKSG